MTKESLFADIWRACDLMRSDDGTTGMMEYMEQLSWILFLKAFEAIEDQHEAEASFARRAYQRILDGDYRWSVWTGPAGMPRLTGPSLIDFVDNTLFPYLRALSGSPERDVIATIFQEIPGNRMKSGYLLREVIDIIDEVDFHAAEDVDTISHIYETLLGKLGGEGGIAGEFYTPRHIIRLMVEIVDPKIGETVYDPACGSAGFLVESYARLKAKAQTSADWETLQRRTFFGREKKPLPYLLGVMNMILHGVQTPRIARGNTLAIDVRHIAEKDRYHVVLTNPPFGGKEHATVQQNFPVPVAATELLFLQHIMKSLKVGGRCGVVVPEGVLFRGDAFAQVKKDLLESFNLHTIVSLPAGVFANVTASGSGPKTNLLFFDRPGPTKDIWYYEVLHDGFTLTKSRRPIPENDLPDCLARWPKRAVSERSWLVPVEELVSRGYDLTAKNPNRKEDYEHRLPEDLVADVLAKEQRIFEILDEMQTILGGNNGSR